MCGGALQAGTGVSLLGRSRKAPLKSWPRCGEQPARGAQRAEEEYERFAGKRNLREEQACTRRSVKGNQKSYSPSRSQQGEDVTPPASLPDPLHVRRTLSILRVSCNLPATCLALTVRATAVLLIHIFPPSTC